MFFENLFESIQTKNLNDLKGILVNNSSKIIQLINRLRKIEKSTIYANELIDINALNVLQSIGLLKNFFPVKVSGDGNCFYYSISYLLFGDCKFFHLIKICLSFIVIENNYFFETVLQRTGSFYDFNNFLFKICSKSEYADEYTQLASSLLLK